MELLKINEFNGLDKEFSVRNGLHIESNKEPEIDYSEWLTDSHSHSMGTYIYICVFKNSFQKWGIFRNLNFQKIIWITDYNLSREMLDILFMTRIYPL